jgi:tripartite-type tricarboxylate transporter receptor subunit TctC
MKIVRRVLLFASLCAAALATAGARAQDFPSKPIKFVVGYAPGGPTDVIARILAQEVGTSLGQPVIVDNKAGANGNIATEFVARAEPDGYTVIVNTLSHNVNPLLNPGITHYNPVRDFSPVTLAVTLPQLLVVPYGSPYKTLADLVNAAKAEPGKVSYGSAGVGGSAHLAGELLAQQAGVQMMHVAFKGNGPALTEVMAGRLTFMFYPMIGVGAYAADRKVRILAVTTEKRHPDYPNVPTMAEAGFPGFEQYVGPVGFLVPAGTPEPVIDKLGGAIRAALAKPEVRDRLRDLGGVVEGSSAAEYREWLKGDAQRWQQLILSAHIKAGG